MNNNGRLMLAFMLLNLNIAIEKSIFEKIDFFLKSTEKLKEKIGEEKRYEILRKIINCISITIEIPSLTQKDVELLQKMLNQSNNHIILKTNKSKYAKNLLIKNQNTPQL